MLYKIALCVFTFILSYAKCPDLTIFSDLKFGDGLGRLPVLWIDVLNNQIDINFKKASSVDLKDIPSHITNVINTPFKEYGNIILVNTLFAEDKIKSLPSSRIRVAYTMHESTVIPHNWPALINNYFDAIIVPDEWLVEVYKNSGVKKPIFVLPLPMYMNDFLNAKQKNVKNKFIFGMSAFYCTRKNHELLIEAFSQEFKNDTGVFLRLHGRASYEGVYSGIIEKIRNQNVKNIDTKCEPLSYTAYLDWMRTLDCYVFLSSGEGFSITPREAMAVGIPVILSNNTAHKVLCDSGLVWSVDCPIKIPAYQEAYKTVLGHQFNPSIEGVRRAMREIYNNYALATARAQDGKKWITRYLPQNLHKNYMSFFKPKRVLLGAKDEIGLDYLVTTSPALYNKYKKIL